LKKAIRESSEAPGELMAIYFFPAREKVDLAPRRGMLPRREKQ